MFAFTFPSHQKRRSFEGTEEETRKTFKHHRGALLSSVLFVVSLADAGSAN
jgi:hypothetical protein